MKGRQIKYKIQAMRPEFCERIIDAFIAGHDCTKGISIKPVDPEPDDVKIWLSSDGNLFCLNMDLFYASSRVSNEEAFDAITKHLEEDTVFDATVIQDELMQSVRSYGPIGNCAFEQGGK